MGSDHHLPLISRCTPVGCPVFSLGSYDAPPPSSHSKESGQSRWLVFTMYPFFFMACFLFSRLILLFVCLSYGPCCYSPCLDAAVVWLFCVSPDRGNQIVFPFTSTHDACLQSRHNWPPCMDMTSETGRNQILAKWQEAFTRLNGNQPGIAGLMNFTKVPCSSYVPVSSAGLVCECLGTETPFSMHRWLGVEVRQGIFASYRYQRSEPKSLFRKLELRLRF